MDPPFGLNKGSGIFVNTVGITWDCDPFFNACSIAITRFESVLIYFVFTCVGFMEAVQTAVAAHDTTGGMATKIAEAASIAAMGIDVYVVEVIYTISFPSFSSLQVLTAVPQKLSRLPACVFIEVVGSRL